MSSVVKFWFAMMLMMSGVAGAREINILVIGDASAAGCNEYLFAAAPNVLQMGKDGNVKLAQDPLERSGCPGGGIWVRVGQQLVSMGIAQRVVLFPVGLPETHVVDWLPGNKAYQSLQTALELAERKNIHFDYALWQQGGADVDIKASRYFNRLRSVIKDITLRVHIGRWIIGQGGCPGVSSAGAEMAEAKMGSLLIYNRFAGPDTATLSQTYRYGSCGLNKAGQYRLADMWVHSIVDADKRSEQFQKESLLYFFR